MEKNQAIRLMETMILCRRFEEKLFELFSTRLMPGTMHQYNGQEAVAAGVCAHLDKADYVSSTHRGHGHCLSKGADVNKVMAEMFAKSTGCCGGMGGSMHIADFSVGMLGANGIVGGGIPIAVGAGLSCQYRGDGHVSVAFFGDGASNEGAFHEAVNLAAVWNLPVIFVIENNMYGFSTHYRRTMTIDNISERSKAYGIPGKTVDGMDVVDVFNAAGEYVEKSRTGKGPAILECKTYRYRGHSRFEDPSYRPKGELESWQQKDPIVRHAGFLAEKFGVSKKELDALKQIIVKKIEDAVTFAEQSPDPGRDDYKRYLYA